jgi:hypothetical protein
MVTDEKNRIWILIPDVRGTNPGPEHWLPVQHLLISSFISLSLACRRLISVWRPSARLETSSNSSLLAHKSTIFSKAFFNLVRTCPVSFQFPLPSFVRGRGKMISDKIIYLARYLWCGVARFSWCGVAQLWCGVAQL